MLPLFVIVLTSVSGLVGTWVLTGGLTPGEGNPVLAVLVAIAIALFLASGFARMERKLLAGRFQAVRKRLRLWKGRIGKEEVALLKLLMALEARNKGAVADALAECADLNIGGFAEAWAHGVSMRLEGREAEAALHLEEAAACFKGVARAELLCEAAFSRLRVASLQVAADDVSPEDVRAANDLIGDAASALHDADGRSTRVRYVAEYQQALRGFSGVVSGHSTNGARRVRASQGRLRHQASLRARRLAVALQIEQALAPYRQGDHDEYSRVIRGLSRKVHLPSLRVRIAAIGHLEPRAVEEAEAVAAPAEEAQGPLELPGTEEKAGSRE